MGRVRRPQSSSPLELQLNSKNLTLSRCMLGPTDARYLLENENSWEERKSSENKRRDDGFLWKVVSTALKTSGLYRRDWLKEAHKWGNVRKLYTGGRQSGCHGPFDSHTPLSAGSPHFTLNLLREILPSIQTTTLYRYFYSLNLDTKAGGKGG